MYTYLGRPVTFSRYCSYFLSGVIRNPQVVPGNSSENYKTMIFMFVPCINSIKALFLLFQTDTDNYKIIEILKQLKFRLMMVPA